ncbi:MAG: hypothetical protein KDA58_00430 [Planctomycetaceae bacterium]|nr:hypothetical protein [Planctomycetaceae bacterium]
MRLRERGLNVRDDGDSRMQVYRPTCVHGNCREDYEANLITVVGEEYGNDVIEVLDAPISFLQRSTSGNDEGWTFRVWDYCPGPGPGDFEQHYGTLTDAVNGVLEYYFGNPDWMCAEYNQYRRRR